MNKVEAFYTGGGIWCACMENADGTYYAVTNDNDYDCLSLYAHDEEEQAQEIEYGFMTMLWSKSVDDLADHDRSVYDELRVALEAEQG